MTVLTLGLTFIAVGGFVFALGEALNELLPEPARPAQPLARVA